MTVVPLIKVVIFSSVIALFFRSFLKLWMSYASFTVFGRECHSTGPLKRNVFHSNSDLNLLAWSLSFLYEDIVK